MSSYVDIKKDFWGRTVVIAAAINNSWNVQTMRGKKYNILLIRQLYVDIIENKTWEYCIEKEKGEG